MEMSVPLEDLLFSAGGGFLFGAVARYAIKKVIKIAAVVVGLFVAGLAYLSYKGRLWSGVKLLFGVTLMAVQVQDTEAMSIS